MDFTFHLDFGITESLDFILPKYLWKRKQIMISHPTFIIIGPSSSLPVEKEGKKSGLHNNKILI